MEKLHGFRYEKLECVPPDVRRELAALNSPLLTLMDDCFCKTFFQGQLDLATEFFRVLTGDRTLALEAFEIQKTIQPVGGRACVMDLYALSKSKTHYFVENENDLSKADGYRMFYNAGLLRPVVTPTGGEIPERVTISSFLITRGKKPHVSYGECYLIGEFLVNGAGIGAYQDFSHTNTYLQAGFHCFNALDQKSVDERVLLLADMAEGDPSKMKTSFIKARSIALKFPKEGGTSDMESIVDQVIEIERKEAAEATKKAGEATKKAAEAEEKAAKAEEKATEAEEKAAKAEEKAAKADAMAEAVAKHFDVSVDQVFAMFRREGIAV